MTAKWITRSLTAVLLGVLILGSTIARRAAAAASEKPNIILFFTDDQGWADTSVPMMAGRADSRSDICRTPHLGRLARELPPADEDVHRQADRDRLRGDHGADRPRGRGEGEDRLPGRVQCSPRRYVLRRLAARAKATYMSHPTGYPEDTPPRVSARVFPLSPSENRIRTARAGGDDSQTLGDVFPFVVGGATRT